MTLEIALMVVGGLITIVGFVSLIISLWLVIKYYTYNRRINSAGLTGIEIARKILDDNGLQDIKVVKNGSLLFGNCYSHYFKKVRLRSFIKHQTSLTSIGMGAQKAALAILDKEGDPDMRKRVRLTPFMVLGPFAFIPLMLVGTAIDLFILNSSGVFTFVFGGMGLIFYTYSIILSVLTLKTERKAQNKAYEILERDYHIPEEELSAIKELFHLYNVQYVNDMILSALELIYTALEIAIAIKGKTD